MDPVEFQIRKDDFRQTRFAAQAGFERAARGELLLRVDRFALTANNVTYALYGDLIGYWKFFPAPEGWGVLPCWGFAEVVDSGCPEVREGERLFGFWPMASMARLSPSRIAPGVLMEGSAERQRVDPNFGAVMSAFYNRYARAAPATREHEAWQALFRPLALTGLMLEDFVSANGAWGATRVVVGSASSKTAIATAHYLKRRGAVEVVGLSAHAEFAQATGAFDRVEPYEAIEALAATPTVYIDFAGASGVTRRVHQRLKGVLQKSILVGGTHWHATAPVTDIPPPAPELFFIPAYLAQRVAELGEAEVDQRFAAAWQSLMPVVQRGVKLEFAEGATALEAGYQALLAGRLPPDTGHVFRI